MIFLLAALALALAHADPELPEPVTFAFLRKAGPADDRKQAYDPKAQAYFIQVQDIARFEVKSVVPDLEKRPVVLHLSGMLDKPEGPLVLILKKKDELKGQTYSLYHEDYDRELFRIQRKGGVTTVEFLPRGKQLLRPGALFQYIDYYRP